MFKRNSTSAMWKEIIPIFDCQVIVRHSADLIIYVILMHSCTMTSKQQYDSKTQGQIFVNYQFKNPMYVAQNSVKDSSIKLF